MPVEPAPTDHRVLKLGQCLVDVVVPLIAHAQAARALLPADRPLGYPAPAPQPLLALDPAPGNPGRDAPLAQAPTQRLVVVGLVRVQLDGPAARMALLAPHRRDLLHRRQQQLAIRLGRARPPRRQREPVPIYPLV